MENKKISLGERRKKVNFASFLPTKQQEKNRKCNTDSDKKATNFGLKLFHCTPKFRYKFKEIISLTFRYVELIM